MIHSEQHWHVRNEAYPGAEPIVAPRNTSEEQMLSTEENELICRVGPGTPMGLTMRRYWLPGLLSEELPESDCPPVRVRLLGEDLVAFRDTEGRVGLLAANCP